MIELEYWNLNHFDATFLSPIFMRLFDVISEVRYITEIFIVSDRKINHLIKKDLN